MNTTENGSKANAPFTIKGALKNVYDRLIKIRGTPKEIALGFALGIFIGFSPTMGLQMAIAVFLASLLKFSKLAAAIGVWITNPVTAPFIYSITYYIGAIFLGIRKNNPIHDEISHTGLQRLIEKTPEFFWCLILGGIIVGIPLSIAAYYFSYSAVTKYQGNIKAQIAKQKEKFKNRKEVNKRKSEKKKKKKT